MRCSLLTLSCYLDEELDARRRGEMEAHLVGCPRCRAGLGHLRQEVDRVGGLARVRVPEPSARALLEVLGVVAPGDPLPARGSTSSPLPARAWSPTAGGSALPWAAPPRITRLSRAGRAGTGSRPGIPATVAGPRPALPEDGPASAAEPAAEVAAEVADSEVLVSITAPAAAPGRTAEEDARREEADVAAVTAAMVPVPGSPTDVDGAALELDQLGLFDAGGAVGVPDRPAPVQKPFAPLAIPEDPPAAADPSTSPPSSEPARSFTAPPPPSAVAPPPSFLDPGRHGRLVEGVTRATSDAPSPAPHPTPTPPGDTPVAVRLPEAAEALYPIDDKPETVVDDPAEGPWEQRRDVDQGTAPAAGGAIEGPIRAPHPSLFERFRDRIAVRRALAGGGDDAMPRGIEVVSGSGAPLRHGGARADLARRRGDALRPAQLEGRDARMRAPRLSEMLPPGAHPSSGAPVTPTSVVVDPPDPRPVSTDDDQARVLHHVPTRPVVGIPAVRAAVHSREAEETTRPGHDDDIDGAVRSFRAAAARVGDTGADAAPRRPQAAGSARERRRLLVLYLGAIAVLLAVGVVSARTTTPIAVPSASGSSSAAAAGSSASSASSSSASAPVAIVPATPPSARTAPTPAAGSPAASQTIGSAGTGWQIQDFRFGDHGSFYRVVVDLTGGTGSSPTVSASNQDPQTVLVTFTATQAAGTPATPSGAGLLQKVALAATPAAPGSVTYRFTLSRAATAHLVYLTSPLRLIIDLS